MRYAMVLKNRVIGILEGQSAVPYWPPDNKGNQVTAVECYETARIGMLYNFETCTFSEYTPPDRVPTVNEQIFAIVSKSKEEIENAAVDAYTEALIEGGIL